MVRFGLILLMLGITAQFALSQTTSDNFKSDSLLSIVSSSIQSNKNKVGAYIKLAELNRENNILKAIEYSQSAYDLSLKANSDELIADALIEMSWCYTNDHQIDKSRKLISGLDSLLSASNNHRLLGDYYMLNDFFYSSIGDYEKAINFAFSALKEYTLSSDTLGLCSVYFNIGLNYYYIADYKNALASFLTSQNFSKYVNNAELNNDLINSIGNVYDVLDENDKALALYFTALNQNINLNNPAGTVIALNNIGSIYIEMENYDDALVYLRRALILSEKQNDLNKKALVIYNLGELYLKNQQYDSAIIYLKESLKIYKKLEDFESLAELNLLIGQCWFSKKRLTEALFNYNLTNGWASKTGNLVLQKKALVKIAEAYSTMNNFREASKCLRLSDIIADSILLNERKQGLKNTELQMKLKEKDIIYQEELNQYMDEKKKDEAQWHIQRLRLILVIIMAISFLVIVLWSFIRSHKINNQLIKKNKEIQEQKTLIEISNSEIKEHYLFTETLLNTIPHPVFYTDKNNRIIGCNYAFEKISGQTVDKLIGIFISDINKNSRLKCDIDHFCGQVLVKNYKQESSMIFADGDNHDVIYYNSEIVGNENESVGRLGIIIDVTDLRQVEHNLKESKEQLREALNAKDKFFNIVAHDLKNPFNGILGLSGLLTESYENQSPDEVRQYISLINTSANHVYNLLDNLLEWARAQSGSIEKMASVFLITDPINECLKLLSHSFDAKKIKVAVHMRDEYNVLADKNMIQSVLRNLIGNAIKYTPEGGSISISINEKDDKIFVSVADTGVGIPVETIPKLFRIDQPVTTAGLQNEKGTGLGLIISQEFIKQNGGELTVVSTLNEGSVFTFSLSKA